MHFAFSVEYKFPTLNEIIRDSKLQSKGSIYARKKREIEAAIQEGIHFGGLQVTPEDWKFFYKVEQAIEDSIKIDQLPMGKVNVNLLWHEKTRKRDPDNVSVAGKFILDALVKEGILSCDSHKSIHSIHHHFSYGEKNAVYVMLEEVDEH